MSRRSRTRHQPPRHPLLVAAVVPLALAVGAAAPFARAAPTDGDGWSAGWPAPGRPGSALPRASEPLPPDAARLALPDLRVGIAAPRLEARPWPAPPPVEALWPAAGPVLVSSGHQGLECPTDVA